MCIKVVLLRCALAGVSAYSLANAAEPPLGSLFTSPAQREVLNNLRDQYQRGLYKGEDSGIGQSSYKFNGVVSQQGKAKVLWVNGSSRVPTYTRPSRRGEYRVNIPEGQVQLKPGQTYQPASATVINILGERSAVD